MPFPFFENADLARSRIANLEGRIDALNATVSSSVNAMAKEDAHTQLAQLHANLEDERSKPSRWTVRLLPSFYLASIADLKWAVRKRDETA